MNMKTIDTFTATIWVGLKERSTGEITTIEEIRGYLQHYVDTRSFCVSLTPTEFIYTNGGESGVNIGIINYPRFPESSDMLKVRALAIAEALRKVAKQLKVCVVFPDETVMVSADDPEQK